MDICGAVMLRSCGWVVKVAINRVVMLRICGWGQPEGWNPNLDLAGWAGY
jgi:hypothetical protein